MPVTIFDAPPPQLRPELKLGSYYGNVTSRMEVFDPTRSRKPWYVSVQVPTIIFPFMREVAKIPPTAAASLALDHVKDGNANGYLLSLYALDGSREFFFDLWYYPYSKAPEWIFRPDMRIP